MHSHTPSTKAVWTSKDHLLYQGLPQGWGLEGGEAFIVKSLTYISWRRPSLFQALCTLCIHWEPNKILPSLGLSPILPGEYPWTPVPNFPRSPVASGYRGGREQHHPSHIQLFSTGGDTGWDPYHVLPPVSSLLAVLGHPRG